MVFVSATAIPTLPRASISLSGHSQVDLSLKEFKILSRRYAAVALPYSQELRILERIYYKGKNQHRSSLFWKKVSEVRRLAARVAELDLRGMFESLRASFHASEIHHNSKSHKSAWTHVPDIDACKVTLSNLRSACSLIDKSRVRFRVAFQSFTTQLTMATFIPLIVSLIAITSRLDLLMAEIRDIISLQWEAVTRVIKAIDVRCNLQSDRSKQLPALPVEFRPVEDALSTRPVKKAKLTEKDLEDLGSKVHREAEQYQEIPAMEGPCMDFSLSQSKGSILDPPGALSTELPFNMSHVDPPQPDDTTPSALTVFHGRDTITPGNATASPPSNAPISSSSNAQISSKSKSTIDVRKKYTKKAKKKRDEIDDIFGF